MLKNTLNNISETFKNHKDDVEVVVRLDTDDYNSHQILSDKFDFDIKFIIDDRLTGYASLPTFLNQGYKLSNSYFITFLNDDIRILNHHNLIENLRKVKHIVSISNDSPTSCFPIIHHKIIDLSDGFNPEVIYTDGHYNAVKQFLPSTNQFNFLIDIEHPVVTGGDHYEQRNIDLENHKKNLEFFDGNYFVTKDVNRINEYFEKYGNL